MAAYGIPSLRVSLGVVFLWFGVLKAFPNLSPAEDLAARTIEDLTRGLVGPTLGLSLLAAWESFIGLGLIFGKLLRVTLFLLFVQMLGTLAPLFLYPAECFAVVPFVPTLEGQYILKNLVLISAGFVLGATVRGGKLLPETGEEAPADPALGRR